MLYGVENTFDYRNGSPDWTKLTW